MLVRFALELDAIDSEIEGKDIRSFVEKWRNCGIMVYPNLNDVLTKTNTIKSRLDQNTLSILIGLGKDLRNGNHTALRCQPLKKDSFSWKTIISHNVLSQQKDKFDVALLGKNSAQKLGIPKGQAKPFGKVQGVRFEDITQSELGQPPSPLEPFRIHVGDRREDIWEYRFQDFASNSQNVFIVDRYAAVNKRHREGIFWLLARLKENSRSYHVTFYSSVKGDDFVKKYDYYEYAREIKTEIEEYYCNKIRKESGISIETRLYHPSIANKYAHDRHIRFDNHVISIGRGLYVLEQPRIEKATNCHQNNLPDWGKDGTEFDLDRCQKGQFPPFTLP